MKYVYALLSLLVFSYTLKAQENLEYQKPPKEILELVDVPAPPYVLIDSKMENMVALFRKQYKTIEELSQNELRLAGLRIDPKTNIGSRSTYWYNAKIKNLKEEGADFVNVTGLPENAKLSNFKWSHDQKMVAMTNTTSTGVEVWVLDLAKAKASKLTDAKVNSNMGSPLYWFKDNKSLLIKMLPEDRKNLIDKAESLPQGPTISINEGKKAQNRTYQDLLQDPSDEFNFEQLARSTLYKVDLKGKKTLWKETSMYRSLDFSPDGEYILVSEIKRPFSYIVTFSRFPSTTTAYSKAGKMVKLIEDVPLIEDLPQGFAAVRTGRRSISWRSDKPSTLSFIKALDDGDPAKEVDFRDELFELEAPFDKAPKSLMKTINRFGGVDWGNDNYAIASDWWWADRNTKSYVFNPSDNKQEPYILFDRNWQDRYSDPGAFVTEKNDFNESIIALKEGNAFLVGEGFSDKGQFPFLDQIKLKTGKTERIYQSEYTNKIESLRDYDLKGDKLLVRIEAPTEFPNYYFRSANDKSLTQLTTFENPFKSIEGIHKEVIKYKREDGLELSATLYLPVGYDTIKKERVPMILWAYPDEFKDKQSAGQNTKNPNEFTYLYWGSPIYWATRGYAILDDASMPIIGEGDKEPNDAFREQLVSNAKAAIDAVDKMGYINPEKVAVGGHSYGAFMVANLLSHSNLFAAGIARSGAYNRTLTPFGFQSEERNYWEAPEVYYTMSPFMHSDKMNTPLLLIHGKADNNSGTYPMQSERYFNALKGLGATVRLVMLPKESHGYRAEESIYHMLWEQDQWLEKYLKDN